MRASLARADLTSVNAALCGFFASSLVPFGLSNAGAQMFGLIGSWYVTLSPAKLLHTL